MKDEENVPGTTSQPAAAPARAYAYGTFQGVARYPPPGHPEPPSIGFPHLYYPYAYQSVLGYAVVEGRPVRERRRPCCGIGCGWYLVDYREKPGLIACTIAVVTYTLGLSRLGDP